MRNLIYLILLPIVCNSCSYTEDKRFVMEEEQLFDQVEIEEPEEVPIIQNIPANLVDLQLDTLQLPFELKEGELEKIPTDDDLNLEQLNFLSQNFEEKEKGDRYYLDETIRIYALKRAKTYEDYTSSLDLAQLADATAHPYGIIHLDSAIAVLWTIQYGSYEACPYYSGKELMATIIQDDEVQKSFLIATENSGGDPPAFGETMATISINKALDVKIVSHSKTFDDEDLVDQEKTEKTFDLWD